MVVSALGNLAPGMATVSVISNQTLSLYINLTYKQPQHDFFICCKIYSQIIFSILYLKKNSFVWKHPLR